MRPYYCRDELGVPSLPDHSTEGSTRFNRESSAVETGKEGGGGEAEAEFRWRSWAQGCGGGSQVQQRPHLRRC